MTGAGGMRLLGDSSWCSSPIPIASAPFAMIDQGRVKDGKFFFLMGSVDFDERTIEARPPSEAIKPKRRGLIYV